MKLNDLLEREARASAGDSSKPARPWAHCRLVVWGHLSRMHAAELPQALPFPQRGLGPSSAPAILGHPRPAGQTVQSLMSWVLRGADLGLGAKPRRLPRSGVSTGYSMQAVDSSPSPDRVLGMERADTLLTRIPQQATLGVVVGQPSAQMETLGQL